MQNAAGPGGFDMFYNPQLIVRVLLKTSHQVRTAGQGRNGWNAWTQMKLANGRIYWIIDNFEFLDPDGGDNLFYAIAGENVGTQHGYDIP